MKYMNIWAELIAIQGKVIHGKKNGKAMGIRTANIEAGTETIIPQKGVYIS